MALGIREWNVFGDSYGTNLAMTLMREHPRGIRSVTLDSVEPPEVVAANLFAPNAREGFGRLFRACMKQPQCWRRRPGIARTFTNLVRRLEAHPVTVRVAPSAGAPPVKVVLDGGRLANWLIDESFNTADYRTVPAMIAELADGNPRPIATQVAARVVGSGTGILGAGLALGVGCGEWIPYMKGSILSAALRARSRPIRTRCSARPCTSPTSPRNAPRGRFRGRPRNSGRPRRARSRRCRSRAASTPSRRRAGRG